MPLFLTQGLTENNTVSDGTAQYLQNHTGYERAWLGPWDHVRGNETEDDGTLKMGRAGWFDEVMRFYDRFLKGDKPKVKDPMIAVQTNDGKWPALRRRSVPLLVTRRLRALRDSDPRPRRVRGAATKPSRSARSEAIDERSIP